MQVHVLAPENNDVFLHCPVDTETDIGAVAHASGVIGISNNATTGFWILHSIPQFPYPGQYLG